MLTVAFFWLGTCILKFLDEIYLTVLGHVSYDWSVPGELSSTNFANVLRALSEVSSELISDLDIQVYSTYDDQGRRRM